jgi:hypothetical protein
MNDHHDSLPEPGDDPMLEEVLSRLKRLEPPLETRIANRMAVAAELSASSNVNRQRHLPWWRRSISVPVPIAASLVVLAAFALQSSFRGWQERPPMHVSGPNQPVEGAADVRGEKTAIAKRTPNGHAVLEYYETETYLCGIGRLKSESGYLIKD